MTVLRPLEFVNFPSKDTIEAIFFICFASVFVPTETALYKMFDVNLSNGVSKKFPGTTCHLWDDVRHTLRMLSMGLALLHLSSTFCCCTFWHVSLHFFRLLGDSLFVIPCIQHTDQL